MPRLNRQNFPEQKEMIGNDNYVFICGDFGGVWEINRLNSEEPKNERYGLNWLDSWLYEKMPAPEKEKLRRGYPRMFWNGGYVRELRPHVLMLEPGVFMINGMKCFVYGGARCHDIQGGILNPTEYFSENEFNEAYKRTCKKGLLFRVKGIS